MEFINKRYRFKLINFFKLFFHDIYMVIRYGRKFDLFGVTVFVGRQGEGKTIAMVDYLDRMSNKFPECLIVTNFDYTNADIRMESWNDIFNIRNGENGVIFAIDEIQNEYDSMKWKEFPEGLLSEITMQRKQRIKIVSTSQIFFRMVKQLREQAFEVAECKTYFNRWTVIKCYDAWEYEDCAGDRQKIRKLYKKWRWSFVQQDELRKRYDTYEKVQKLAKEGFIDREIRFRSIGG